MSSNSPVSNETPHCSTSLVVPSSVSLGTCVFFAGFFFLTEVNFIMCKEFIKYHHFSLSNITCGIEELMIILAAFSYCKGQIGITGEPLTPAWIFMLERHVD